MSMWFFGCDFSQARVNSPIRLLVAGLIAVVATSCAHTAPAVRVADARQTVVRPAPQRPAADSLELTRYSLKRAVAQTHCPYGMPIARDLPGESEYVHRLGYDLLHSATRKTPFWVCEHYTRTTLIDRFDRDGLYFEADPELELGHATPLDYKERSAKRLQIGHMAAAEAHSSSNQRMVDTFYLSNAVPQNQSLNGGRWARLEACSRNQTPSGGAVWVISGPAYRPDAQPRYLGEGVAIPDYVWKIVLIESTATELTAWAVLFPNEKMKDSSKWERYVVSIDEVEEVSGFDFFPEMDEESQGILESAGDLPNCPKA